MRYFLYCRKSQQDKERQVLSLSSQQDVALEKFGSDISVTIVEIIEEARTAKSPGRPLFNAMLARIERGEADGIVAYAPDRLSRNAVDAGAIVHLLDLGVMKDLKFVNYTFENNPAGKLMLQILLAQSKHFSDALAERVRIGLEKKLSLGWRPNRAPEGYLNDRETGHIVCDPERFPFIRRIFEEFLTGVSPAAITLKARHEWGYLTRRSARQGGRPLALSTVYKILSNPFYAGLIRWNGQVRQGAHTPVVSLQEFKEVQERLGRTNKARPQVHRFTYTGLIRCGSCGHMITADAKTKPSGRAYAYYHCTRRGLGPRCTEPAITPADLEAQMITFLSSLQIDPAFEAWALGVLSAGEQEAARLEAARLASLTRAAAEIETQLEELTSLRLRRLLSDEDFLQRRKRLEFERLRLSEAVASVGNEEHPSGLTRNLISLRNEAADWFQGSSHDDRRFIVETVGSDLRLTAKKLSIQAAKPFVTLPDFEKFLRRCGVVEDVKTDGPLPAIAPLVEDFIRRTQEELFDPDQEALRKRLPQLVQRFQAWKTGFETPAAEAG